MSVIQSVLINREYFPKISEAVDKLQNLGYSSKMGVDITKKYYRFRQFNPDVKRTHYTREIEPGIKLIVELPSPEVAQRRPIRSQPSLIIEPDKPVEYDEALETVSQIEDELAQLDEFANQAAASIQEQKELIGEGRTRRKKAGTKRKKAGIKKNKVRPRSAKRLIFLS